MLKDFGYKDYVDGLELFAGEYIQVIKELRIDPVELEAIETVFSYISDKPDIELARFIETASLPDTNGVKRTPIPDIEG